jgi:tRNA(fMet)-specific endonuclease VapC
MPAPQLLLLDTNVLVHLVRGDALGERIRAQYSPALAEPRPLISVVTDGELRSLTYQFGWDRRKAAHAFLHTSYFTRVSIDHAEILDAYAVIDAFVHSVGRPMGKNDVWIAATAHALQARILTTDHDFEPLAPRFFSPQMVEPVG